MNNSCRNCNHYAYLRVQKRLVCIFWEGQANAPLIDKEVGCEHFQELQPRPEETETEELRRTEGFDYD